MVTVITDQNGYSPIPSANRENVSMYVYMYLCTYMCGSLKSLPVGRSDQKSLLEMLYFLFGLRCRELQIF